MTPSYTHTLGFKKKQDIPVGDYRWLTVVSPEGPDDIELLLEPTGFPPAQTYHDSRHDHRGPRRHLRQPHSDLSDVENP